MATALRVGKPYFPDPFVRRPINQLLCGPFTGPGSEAMVIVFTFPTCWPVQRWAVFQYVDARWQLVLDQPSYLIPPLQAVGSDIREATAVHRRGDSRCFPSGGTRARNWHWSGTRLVAGPWQQLKPPASPPPPPAGTSWATRFRSPSGNIICAAYTRGSPAAVECGIKTGLKPKPPYTAECKRLGLDHTGDRIGIRSNGGRPTPPACSGDAGPFVPLRMARVLGYGKTWTGAGLSCRSAFTGMSCRNRRGHGFFLSRASWRTF